MSVDIKTLYERHGKTVDVKVKTRRLFGLYESMQHVCYLWIEHDDGIYTVSRANGRTSHSPYNLFGQTPIIAASFNEDGTRRNSAYQSAVSLWRVTEEAKRDRIYDKIEFLIHLALKMEEDTARIELEQA